MTAFRFIFPEDDEGFELVEIETTAEVDDDENVDSQTSDDEVIWETEED